MIFFSVFGAGLSNCVSSFGIFWPCPSNVEVLLQHGEMSMYYFEAKLTLMFYFLTCGRKNGSVGLSHHALKRSFHIERQVNHSGSLQSGRNVLAR